jgi:hypothetical protein
MKISQSRLRHDENRVNKSAHWKGQTVTLSRTCITAYNSPCSHLHFVGNAEWRPKRNPRPPTLPIFLLLTSSRRLRRHFCKKRILGGGRNHRLNFESLVKSEVLSVHTKKKREHYLTPSSVLQTISVFPLSKSAMFQIIENAVNLGGLSHQRFGWISKWGKTCLWNRVVSHFSADLSYHALKSNGAMKQWNAWSSKLAFRSGKSSLWMWMWRFHEMRGSMMLSFTNRALHNILWLLLRCYKEIQSPQRFIPFICI